jgi:hypothetical protein
MLSPFIENKYKRWYYNIIKNRKQNLYTGYTENHHIIPKCMGGSNDEFNRVKLTAREHFICHFLLLKMLPKGKDRNNMILAVSRMSSGTNGIWAGIRYFPKSSKIYETIRKEFSLSNRGKNHPLFGKPMSEETKAKLSASKLKSYEDGTLAKKLSESRKQVLEDGTVAKKISESLKGKAPPNKGKPMSAEQRAKVSAAHKGKTISLEQRALLSAKSKAMWERRRKQKEDTLKV